MLAAIRLGREQEETISKAEKQRIISAARDLGKYLPVDEVYITGDESGGKRFLTIRARHRTGRVDQHPRRSAAKKWWMPITWIRGTVRSWIGWLRGRGNPYFAKALVNRVSARFFNVAVVEPADDMNLANAPSNKELLEWLAQEFISHELSI